MAANLDVYLAFDSPTEMSYVLDSLAGDPRFVVAQVFDRSGKPFGDPYDSDPDANRTLPTEANKERQILHDRDNMHLWHPIVIEGSNQGWLYISIARAENETRTRQRIALLTCTFLVAFAASAILLSRLLRSILTPITELAELTQHVSETDDYSLRSTYSSNNEIGDLHERYNAMLAHIEESETELKRMNDELENRVVERTQSLQMEVTNRMATESRLRENEELYRSLVETSTNLIWSVNSAGRFVFFNHRPLMEIYASTPKDMLQHLFVDFSHPDNRDADQNMLKRAMSGERIQQYETRHVRPDGQIRELVISAAPRVNAVGEVLGAVGMAIDVTQVKEAEQREEALQARLVQAERMESLGLLAGGVAHDLNNILGPLVAYPDMMRGHLPDNSPLHEDLDEIKTSARLAANVIRDLLTLSRRGKSEMVPTDLSGVLASFFTSKLFQNRQTQHAGVEVVRPSDTSPHWMLGSEHNLSQLIMNLVFNAMEAIGGTGKVHVTLVREELREAILGMDTFTPGDFLHLQIADNGSGIPTENLDRIFDPFFSTKKVGKSGTGLGLAIVYGAVHDQHGGIQVHSSPEKGTCFDIWFPAISQPTETEAPPEADLTSLEGLQVLVIDDDVRQRSLARRILSSAGCSVKELSGGKAAADLVTQDRPDVVMIDMIMDPDFDGLDTYRSIQQQCPGLPCILATGFAESERLNLAIKEGARGHLRKPYLGDRLLQTIIEASGQPQRNS